MSAAPLPPERLAEIRMSLPPFPAPGTLVRGLHETVAEIDRLTTKLDRSEAESRMWRGTAWAEANTVWSSELPPGGLVCADPECGQPVESEPCEEHNPRAVAERLTARVAELETERHWTNEALSDAAEAIRVKETAERTVFRASYDETFLPLGHYATRQAAMGHVHHVLAREENTTASVIETRVIWRADDPDEDEPEWECWLFDVDGADDKPTGYTVGPIEIATAYDPDGDE